jgi:MoaA/NifB/PqqE/SkfB family radical SAM enzyme
LTALQIEVTSRCTRQCRICPRTVLAADWRDGDLDTATWERLAPDVGLARHVHLQGWGEPLLHPRIPEMVDDAKAAGCAVGITTNGDLLDDATEWVVTQGVDLITVSVAGDDKTHAELRSGSRLDELWARVERLAVRRAGRKVPRIQVSYLLTRRNCGQVPRVVEAAAEAGADELFVTHLDCTPSPELLKEAAFDTSGLSPEATAAIETAAEVARSRKIAFRAPAREPQELLVCALDPLSFAFVTWDGRVGPCVNLLLPVDNGIPRRSEEGPIRVEPMVYGDLAESRLREILASERFNEFTRSFEKRLAAEREFLEGIVTRGAREALDRLDDADRRRERELSENPFPEPCAGCHKVVGW